MWFMAAPISQPRISEGVCLRPHKYIAIGAYRGKGIALPADRPIPAGGFVGPSLNAVGIRAISWNRAISILPALYMASGVDGGPPILQGAYGRGHGLLFRGLVMAMRSASFSAFSLYRWFRLFVFSSAFGVGLGRLAVAAVSCLCLVLRVRHIAPALLN